MCVGFLNLNKANPKDDFPLVHIDVFVENIASYKSYLSWMDFSMY